MLKMTKERAEELGLITRKEDCLDCAICIGKGEDNRAYCGSAAKFIDEMGENIDCPELDEDRIRMEMTEEEYDAYRHNRLEIEGV